MILLQFPPPQQESESTDQMLSPIFPPVETFQQVRQTKVDPSNKVLWSLVATLHKFFAHLLRKVAMPPNMLQTPSDERILHSLCVFKCAHDPFNDSGVQKAPHLLANFTEAIKKMADVIAKHKMQDSEKQQYELIAQEAKNQLVKAEKAFATASNKVKAVIDKTVKCDEKETVKELRSKLLADAQKAAADAKLALNETSKAAAEASTKAAMVLDIQADITQRLQDAMTQMKQVASSVDDNEAFPACIASCEIYLAPCAGLKAADSTCTPWGTYI